MASKPLLLIRSDASSDIGAGHISRCMSLGKAWNRQGGETVLLSSEITFSMEQKVGESRICFSKITAVRGTREDAICTANFALRKNCNWLVLDGYCFGSDYQRYLHEINQKLLIIDDQVIEGKFHCDLLLNQNIGVSKTDYQYRIEQDTRLLLGPTYALIDPKFSQRGSCLTLQKESKKRVTICLGGGNSLEASRLILEAFDLMEDEQLEIVILFPEGNQDILLKDRKSSKHKISVVHDWNHEVVKFLKTSTLGVVGGGHTMLEFLCVGIPISVLIVADNQRLAVSRFEEKGVVCNLGQLGTISSIDISNKLSQIISDVDNSKIMSIRGQRLVDGHGVDRVIEHMIVDR